MATRTVTVRRPICGSEKVTKRTQQYWLWRVSDHQTGVPLTHCFGTREHRIWTNCGLCRCRFIINIVYAAGDSAYKSRISESAVVTGKKHTQRIERKHLSMRTWCSRLVRKTLRFPKLYLMHDLVVGLVINCRLLGEMF